MIDEVAEKRQLPSVSKRQEQSPTVNRRTLLGQATRVFAGLAAGTAMHELFHAKQQKAVPNTGFARSFVADQADTAAKTIANERYPVQAFADQTQEIITAAETSRIPDYQPFTMPKFLKIQFPNIPERDAAFVAGKINERLAVLFQYDVAADFAPILAPYQADGKTYNLIEFATQNAKARSYPPDLVLAMLTIENGGSLHEDSEAGAFGIAQLMPKTARAHGLFVPAAADAKPGTAAFESYRKHPDPRDERLDPLKSISAAVSELTFNMAESGDPLLALEAYNAGIGTVFDMVDTYSNNACEENGNVSGTAVRSYVKQHNLQFYSVLENQNVKNVLRDEFRPEAQYYVYQALGAKLLWQVRQNYLDSGKTDAQFLADLHAAKSDTALQQKLLQRVGWQFSA